MKYWKDDDILERDIIEGESIFVPTNPHPAYKGMKILASGKDYLFEVEIVPNTERMETIVDPTTFNSIIGNVCTIIHRQWDDNTSRWNEITIPCLLSTWGYSTIPPHQQAQTLSAFDAAMKGV